jgi:hypothetical protein
MIKVISCNPRDCPWHSITMVGGMSECDNSEAPFHHVARKMEVGTPDLCPVRTNGPYFVVATKDRPLFIESVAETFEEWKALWRSHLDKAL